MTSTEATESSVVEALVRIAKDDPDGLIRPEDVVHEAADPKSPLHDQFTWDDSEAAHRFRLVQARALITRVRVTADDNRPVMVNVTVRAGSVTARRGYVPVARAVVDPDLYEQVLGDIVRGIRAYRNRLAAFEQSRDLVRKLDEALKGVES